MNKVCIKILPQKNAGMILLPFHLFLILHMLTAAVTDGQQLQYTPVEDITINCGSSGNNTRNSDYPRNWAGDVGSKFFPLEGQNSASNISATVDPTVLSEVEFVPFGTARLSLSEFFYVIPVNPGPKFIRLYFLSARYKNFDSSKAFFSVKVDQYTLLNNFSVDLTADHLGKKFTIKEFCVTIFDSSLSIKFSPSTSTPDAFAFINGIEVVSMPTDLYYSDAEEDHGGLTFVGQQNKYIFANNTALEMMYRVSIGGTSINPKADTDFFRSWEDLNSEYALYLTTPGSSALPVNPTAKLEYTKIPFYIAPDVVYQTARSMGNDKETNKKYNLTWEFLVDSEFNYMVRLHFCEIDSQMTSIGDRRFLIYMADQIAVVCADVIYWTGGKYIPYFKDYIVQMFGTGGTKKVNLSVALRANPDDWQTVHTDAILNGVEIFKLNDTKGNLAGPNPDPITLLPSLREQEDIKVKSKRTPILIIVSGVVSGLILLCIIGVFILRQRKKLKESGSSNSQGTPLPTEICGYFSLAEIRAGTNNFDDNFIIGVGGFGNVYKAHLNGGATTVAVKRLKPQSSQGAREFTTEIEMLSHLRHRHLVALIGYCNENGEMILVYEYVPRGTLSSHLYNTNNPPLTWKQRLQICIGAASGLHYLHRGVKHTIIHRDVKTSNILLDERFVAKVSDFGLAKVGPTTLSKTHVSTMVKGSFGYLDPEYYRRQLLTEKSDVYSFGVVLCEVLCGRPPIMRTVKKKQMYIAEWVRSCYQERKLKEIVDPCLTDKIAPECLKKFCEIAVSCTLDEGAERPLMKEVLRDLEFAMQLQHNEEENVRLGGEPSEMIEDGTVRIHCSWEDKSGSVFSDIKGLQGR